MSRISSKSVLLVAAGAVVLATLGVVALLEGKVEALERRLKTIEAALEEVTTPGVRPVMRLRPPDPIEIPFRPTIYANGWRCGETNGLPHCAGPIVHRSR